MKSKIFLGFVSFLYMIPVVQAQDVIIQRNGDELQVKVVEVDADHVKYKRFSNLTGPTYVIRSSDIFMIRYEDESRDLFEKNLTTGKISIRHVANNSIIPQTEPSENPDKLAKETEKIKLPETKPFVADPTDAKEQFELGLAYEKGDGVSQDYQKASDWYLKAAEQGYAEAQYNLGVLCSTIENLRIKLKSDFTMRNGVFTNAEGYPIPDGTALYWWREAAKQGHAEAKEKAKEMEAKYNPKKPKVSSAPIKEKEVVGISNDRTTATMEVNNKTYNISIGEIGKDDDGNTSVEILAPKIGVFTISGADLAHSLPDFTSPLWMKIIAGGKTYTATGGMLSADQCVMYFKTTAKPEKIIVYDLNSGDEKPSVTFDGRTKKVI